MTEQLGKSLAASPADVAGMTLIVFDEDDVRVYEQTVGDFGPDREIPIASASKLASGLAILRLVDEGLLTLESTTEDVLGWQDENASLTLDQLGGFVSGLQRLVGCTFQQDSTLQSCVDFIETRPLGTPEAELVYSNTHLHVAARMSEVASSRFWQAIADDFLFEPLGIKSANLLYYTNPKMALGTTNPLIAGGLRSTTNQYAEILALLFHKGRRGSVQR